MSYAPPQSGRVKTTEFFYISVKFYICEVLNAANAVAQFYFTAWFLNGNFSKIATEGLYLEENESVLPILSECKLSM